VVSGQLRAGAARAEIGLDGALPLNGFGFVHDPLFVRALVLDDAARVVLVLIDQTSLIPEVIAEVKSIASRLAGVPPEAVLVIATHTFSAPHVLPAQHVSPGEVAARARLADAISAAVKQSVAEAIAALRPARVRAGCGLSRVGVNRDVATPNGWWLGANPGGVTDPVVPVVVFDDAAGRTIAVVASVAVQSSVTSELTNAAGVRPVSSDLAGAAASKLEAGGGVALVFTGAAGDQAPAFEPNDAFQQLDRLGAQLGADLCQAVVAAQPISVGPIRLDRSSIVLDAQVIPGDIHDIVPSRHYVFAADGTVAAPWVSLSLGQVVFVGVQPELSATTGIALRGASPFAHTLVMALTDGGAKYMADAGAYDRITYEAMNSKYARGSAERFADAITARLRVLHDQAGLAADQSVKQKD